MLLAVGDGNGRYHRYAIADRVPEGLEVDVGREIYRYEGPLYAITTGHGVSFTHMCLTSSELIARIEIEFDAQPQDTVPSPFPVIGRFLRKLSGPLARE